MKSGVGLLEAFYKNLFILVLAVQGFRCCVQAFSGFGEWGLLLVAKHSLLTVVASLVTEPRL